MTVTADSIGLYVINLDKDAARYEAVIPELKKFGLPITRVPGVYGKDLTDSETAALTTSICNAFCTPSMIGCAASHVKSWKTFLQSDYDFGLICEDDIILAENSRQKLLEALNETPSTFDVLYAGCLHCTPTPEAGAGISTTFFNIITGGRLNNPNHRVLSDKIYIPKVALGTHCYLVSRPGAEKLVKLFDGRIGFHVDVQLNMSYSEVEVYAMHPLIAFQRFDPGDSNNIPSRYPALLNYIADHFSEGGLPGSYVMTSPGGQVCGLVLNGWMLVLPLLAFMLGYMGGRWKYLYMAVLASIVIPDIHLGSMQGHWHLPLIASVVFCLTHQMKHVQRMEY